MVGDAILVCPITEDDVERWTCYLPGGTNQYWFNLESSVIIRGTGNYVFQVTMNSKPHFYRGGSIVPVRETIRSTATATLDDPITLYALLDNNGHAEGTLYVDDTSSFNYKNKEYTYLKFTYIDEKFQSDKIDTDATYNKDIKFDRLVIYTATSEIKRAELTTKTNYTKELKTTYTSGYLSIENINHDLNVPFEIKLLR